MSAIYQRARPINWEQVIGQEHVKDVLRSALEAGRVGHAYLFSGPRGVGKTTTARLIAMTANCQSKGKRPCGECESCLSVRAGSHPDVLEIDAASNNSVDDVRDLREKVGLSAMRGGKKIYILDEAHMMSRAAFNALLKTLEEPPEHVIFILATTEPEKILPTILSRCQHYRFRRLTSTEIAGKLSGLVIQEGATADDDALQLIGRLADGAMRDGESLLERMLAAGQAVTRSGVEAALGLPPSERVREMALSLVNLDAGPLLSGAAQLYRDGYAARTVVEGLVAALGQALHAELGLETEPQAKLEGAQIPRLLRLQAALDAQEARFSRGADQLSLELALTHALIAGEASSATPAAARPTQSAAGTSAGLSSVDAARLAKLEREVSALVSNFQAGAGSAPVVSIGHAAEAVLSGLSDAQALTHRPEPQPSGQHPTQHSRGNWADLMNLQQTNAQLRAFLKPAHMHAEAGYVSLSYEPRGKFHAKQIYDKFDELGRLVLQVFGPVTFELISPEHNRKAVLGGGQFAAPTNNTAPSNTAPTPSRPATPPLDDIPDFMPSTRGRAAALKPIPAPTAPEPDDLPPFEPSNRAARPTPIRPEPLPASPDDAAAAPLPRQQPQQQRHVADSVAAPDQSASPPAASQNSAGTTERELYIPLEISQEPDWDDLGGPLETSIARSAAPTAKPLAVPTSAPSPAPPSPAQKPAAASATASGEGLRGHPNYLEVTRLFSGRIKEIGKVKKPPSKASDEGEDTVDEADSEVGTAEA